MTTTIYRICIVFNDGGVSTLEFDASMFHLDETRVLNRIIETNVGGFVFFKRSGGKPIAVNLSFVALMSVDHEDNE